MLPIYGGQSLGLQLQALRRGVDVVVATPGRALDDLRRGTLALGRVRAVVLDEADEMLDMGFADDLEAILGTLPEERQTALFSATMPSRITAIAERGTARAAGDFTRLYVSVGRAAEVRPGDLVGAITGEAGLQGGDIGAIEIADRHSLVEVREDRAEDVLKALRGTTIRGRPVTASRYRPPARDGRAAPRSAPRPTSTRRRTSSQARPRR